MLVVRIAMVAALLAGCGSSTKMQARWPDAPVALRDDADRDQAIDQLWVVPPGPDRERMRGEVAAAVAKRITDAIVEERPFAAALLLDQLTWMWHADPAAIGKGLVDHVRMLERLRGVFAKSGALEPAIQTLVLLAEVEPAQRAARIAEIDEILAFADELAISDNGANATRAQPLLLLQPTALALPLPWLVDRYVTMLIERQRGIAMLIDKQGATLQLVRAHHDILTTSRRIANVLARAGRVVEIHVAIQKVKGLGSDRELSTRAEILHNHATVDAYLELADVIRTDEHAPDAAAALATCLAGLAKFPGDPSLAAAAAADARTLGRIDQAIQLYEMALRGSPEVDTAAALRLGKLYGERIGRLAGGGRPHAAKTAWRGVLEFTSKSAKAHPHTVWQQTAAIAESALGRGLASQGLIDDAKHALVASLERAPSIDAYETLTTIDVQIERYASAREWATTGLSMLGDASSGDRYRRAKLERIEGDALRGLGKTKEATARYLDSMRSWASLGETKDLPRTIAAERLLDSGRAMFWMGDKGAAIDLVMRAVDVDTDTPDISASAVAFLIEADLYRDALDAYHRALGANLSDFYKVYMSLWIAGEAKRLGEPLDRLAAEYLESRQGDTWYELLARAATGRVPFATLRASATTGPRQAELAFYTATLELDPGAASPAAKKKLFAQVLSAHVVLDAEYDLARRYLASIP
ncbi:MAG: hypothetical protein H0T46_24360 [Deltaproteobacteria bacterium]|nr:hypothetical protein [Deltaproteobacteria bacterium]